jgi:hypothetical protein
MGKLPLRFGVSEGVEAGVSASPVALEPCDVDDVSAPARLLMCADAVSHVYTNKL